jgi:hypothetical protein
MFINQFWKICFAEDVNSHTGAANTDAANEAPYRVDQAFLTRLTGRVVIKESDTYGHHEPIGKRCGESHLNIANDLRPDWLLCLFAHNALHQDSRRPTSD